MQDEVLVLGGGVAGCAALIALARKGQVCCVVQRKYSARAGLRWERLIAEMQQDRPHLAMRLDGAEPLLERPISVTHIPLVIFAVKDGLSCIGTQAAVIPSFIGDSMSITLPTARRATAAYFAAEPARSFNPNYARRCVPRCASPSSPPTA